MVAYHMVTDLPNIEFLELEQRPPNQHLPNDPELYWHTFSALNTMDEEYNTGGFQGPTVYPHHESMHRFLNQDGPWNPGMPSGVPSDDPQLYGKSQPPMDSRTWKIPHHWPQNAYDACPQDSGSNDWSMTDQESCSGATNSAFSPRTSEVCASHERRWSDTPAYPAAYPYSGYGQGMPPGPSMASPQSNGISLCVIQHLPDTESEEISSAEQRGEEVIQPPRLARSVTVRSGARGGVFHHDEGIGSSINDSAIASPSSEQDDEMAVGAVSGGGEDDDDGSDYRPSGRSKRTSTRRKSQGNAAARGSSSPTMRRSSTAKLAPNVLTKPARIAKRTSSASKVKAKVYPADDDLVGTKTSRTPCTHCSSTFASPSALSKHISSAHTRPFSCSFRRYGCDATFGSKNEWKRHVTSQHLLPGIYRCDIGTCAASAHRGEYTPNDFNRKDLFTQHVRRMHGPGASAPQHERESFEARLENVRKRCWVFIRGQPPRAVCGFCKGEGKEVVFEGKTAWDERMEHVGRHLESRAEAATASSLPSSSSSSSSTMGSGMGEEVEDVGLREWMERERLVEFVHGVGWRAHGVGGRRRGRGVAAVGGGSGGEEGIGVGLGVVGDGEEDAYGEDE